MEQKLVQQFQERRKQGKLVKIWWFISKARKIMSEEYYSNRWFNGFCRWYRISLHRKAYVAQKSPATLKKRCPEVSCKAVKRTNPWHVLTGRHSKHGSNATALCLE